MNYQHTQEGRLMKIVALIIFVYLVFVAYQINFQPEVILAIGFIMFLLYSFSSLEVKIDDQYLRIKFGWGIFKKSFLLSDIKSAKKVENSWYHGWGIRFWFWPRMIIFNVSGYGAVEIKMENGKIYRIGTDEPSEIEFAIQENIK